MLRQKKSGSGDRVTPNRSSSGSSSTLNNQTESPRLRRSLGDVPGHRHEADDEENASASGPDIQSSSDQQTRGQRKSRANVEHRQRQLCTPSLPSASSDEDIDPELREGIHNIMKLRDEYDKLEGALRKLGVDSEIGNSNNLEDFEDEGNIFDEGEFSDFEEETREVNCRPLNPVPPPLLLAEDFSAISADPFADSTNTINNSYCKDDSLHPRTARQRHLEILEEVDESVLSSDPGEEPPFPPPPPSYPWIQMALPGGGIVSVSLHSDNNSEAGATSETHQHRHLPKALTLPTSGVPLSSQSVSGADILTVPAGEPVTHFNLDQLLEIVQSFQLDTTMASHEQSSHAMDLGSLLQQVPDTGLAQGSKDVQFSGCDVKHCDSKKSSREMTASDNLHPDGEAVGGDQSGGLREIHSCPSSPTETECSSGFSTLRRRSVTLTEKIRTNRDGSKTQVVRQYGCNTTSAGEANQSTYQQKSYVYINGAKVSTLEEGIPIDDDVGDCSRDTAPGGPSFSSMLPLTNASHSTAPSMTGSSYHHNGGRHQAPSTFPRSTNECLSNRGVSAIANSSSSHHGHFVRLNSIEPNTVMFSTRDYPILNDISVPEIIDELEKQFSDKLCDLQGVRLVANSVYICLSRKESLQHLSTYGFYVRGVPVKLVDITHDSVVLCLSGVPHYITDATVTMLVSTFGIAIGEVERRFYKGVDTGERYVRLKPRSHTQVPDQITVGGCKIFISVLSNEEVCQPYTLHSATSDPPQGYPGSVGEAYNSQTTAHFANSSIIHSVPSMSASDRGSGLPGNFRAKPGHCNGTLNSPGEAPGSSMGLPLSMNRFSSMQSRCEDSSSLPGSPKIARSFRSISVRSPPTISSNPAHSGGSDDIDRTYIAGEPLDFPSLSPPPYKTPSSAGSSSASNGGRHGNHGIQKEEDVTKKSLMSRKFRQSNKTDSSTSLASQVGLNKAIAEAPHNLCAGKRTSVNFEEPRGHTMTAPTSHSSTSTAAPHGQSGTMSRAAIMTSKTVNGILRKGSVPGDDIIPNPQQSQQESNPNNSNNATQQKALSGGASKNNNDKESVSDQQQAHQHSRKSRKNKEKHSSNKSGKSKSSKLDSLPESGLEDGESTLPRSSRSRSSSSKSSVKADKTAKDLALTRDLPWCGCWGNGCL